MAGQHEPASLGIAERGVDGFALSALRSGVKTSSYESHYWKRRGSHVSCGT